MNKRVFLGIGAVILAILIGIVSFFIINLDKPLIQSDINENNTIVVTIEQGSSVTDIGNLLEEKCIIKSTSTFKVFTKIKGYGDKYLAGTYALSPAMDLSQIADELMSGISISNSFTVPEGYSLTMIADKIQEEGFGTREEFMDIAANGDFDYSFLEDIPKGETRLEGFLFPETYMIPIDGDIYDIINIMLAHFDKVFDEDMRKQAENRDMSIREILTVASIVERESKVDEERGKVASVIYNRMDIDMPLQMCSTVQYILGEPKENLTYADIAIESPFNTYLHQGLPPAPICCPGLASIKAALEPDDTDYLYFVVSDKLDGTQKFSETIEQFEKDKAAYSKALEGQN